MCPSDSESKALLPPSSPRKSEPSITLSLPSLLTNKVKLPRQAGETNRPQAAECDDLPGPSAGGAPRDRPAPPGNKPHPRPGSPALRPPRSRHPRRQRPGAVPPCQKQRPGAPSTCKEPGLSDARDSALPPGGQLTGVWRGAACREPLDPPPSHA